MHRKPLLDLLARYRERHPAEAVTAERMRALVEAHPDCFDRRCLPGHVTGSAFVLSHDLERFLLVHHRKLDRWLQVGGHADGDPDVAAVALREAREESGLERLVLALDGEAPWVVDLDVHPIPAHGSEPAHEHHDVRFLVVAGEGETARASAESHAVRWFPLAALESVAGDESVLRLGRKVREHLASGALRSRAPDEPIGSGR